MKKPEWQNKRVAKGMPLNDDSLIIQERVRKKIEQKYDQPLKDLQAKMQIATFDTSVRQELHGGYAKHKKEQRIILFISFIVLSLIGLWVINSTNLIIGLAMITPMFVFFIAAIIVSKRAVVKFIDDLDLHPNDIAARKAKALELSKEIMELKQVRDAEIKEAIKSALKNR